MPNETLATQTNIDTDISSSLKAIGSQYVQQFCSLFTQEVKDSIVQSAYVQLNSDLELSREMYEKIFNFYQANKLIISFSSNCWKEYTPGNGFVFGLEDKREQKRRNLVVLADICVACTTVARKFLPLNNN